MPEPAPSPALESPDRPAATDPSVACWAIARAWRARGAADETLSKSWVGWGRPVVRRRLDAATELLGFERGQRFALLVYERLPGGRVHRATAILEALAPGDPGLEIVPMTEPGAEVLTIQYQRSKPRPAPRDAEGGRRSMAVGGPSGGAVDRLNMHMAELIRRGLDPTRVRPAYWRAVGQRVATRMPVRLPSRDELLPDTHPHVEPIGGFR